MAKQLLERSQIRARAKEMSRETVSQGMRRGGRWQAEGNPRLRDGLAHLSGVERATSRAFE